MYGHTIHMSRQVTSGHVMSHPFPHVQSEVQWFVFQHVQGEARQGGHNKFHIAVVVVVGTDESVSNERICCNSLFPPFLFHFFPELWHTCYELCCELCCE